ncbi:MAG TPA: hypothetical protein VHP37_15445 [Burkholderiales bacterium]|nr:hypothetical protein [Burkholderiales bacterium]
MTADDYFSALCNAEAGDFIYRRVVDVAGIVELRPRLVPTDYELQHLYALEDPFGVAFGVPSIATQNVWVQPFVGRYTFVDVVRTTSTGPRITTYYRDLKDTQPSYQTFVAGRYVVIPYVVSERESPKLSARYGFTWRGIKRPVDREFGIAGGELIVVDVTTAEVLALRRGFVKTGTAVNSFAGVWWLGAAGCPQNARDRNGRREKLLHHDFIYSVLVPSPDANKLFSGALNGVAK